MSLRIFNHQKHTVLTSRKASSSFVHVFGGSMEEHGIRVTSQQGTGFFRRALAKIDRKSRFFKGVSLPRCHILYSLDLNDRRLGISIPNVTKLPLVYGFHYASIGGEFNYRVDDDRTVTVTTHSKRDFREDFPYSGFASHFRKAAITFSPRAIDVASARDALEYQGVFGLSALSEPERERAVTIAKAEKNISFEDFKRPFDDDWDDYSVLNVMGRSPFAQAAPSRICTNPDCTVPINEYASKIFDTTIREESRTVFALHEPDRDDEVKFSAQILFQICDYCKVISVTNQCG